MILTLVDRRTGADGASREFHGEQWARLERLALGLGRANWTVAVVLVDDEAIADLNLRFRSKAGVTDVLSFSYLESGGSGTPDLGGDQNYAATNLWAPADPSGAPESVVGELVLAPEFVAVRCVANDWPISDEVPMLVVHGCLHLLGWDHEEVSEGRLMQDCEMKILAAEGLSHPLRQRSGADDAR